jgi:hypothetical protein
MVIMDQRERSGRRAALSVCVIAVDAMKERERRKSMYYFNPWLVS